MAMPKLLRPESLQDLLLYRLARLLATGGAPVVRLCEGAYGITRREWRMIAALASAGSLHPSGLAVVAELDRSRTSRAISSLVAKGLVKRNVQASDQRFAQVTLTPEGERLHEEVFPQVARINTALLAVLDAQQTATLGAALEAMQREADRLQAVPDDGPKANRRRGRPPRTGRPDGGRAGTTREAFDT